eukprot:scpid101552/ scgid32953/ PiggyBac transposable element-derived protein 4
MKKFLALYIFSGLVEKSWWRDYWSTDFLVFTPAFPAIMGRDGFLLILQFLHFTDNATADKEDKLYKARPLIDLLLARFQSVYRPSKYINVDEELVKFKGRVRFRQFIPSKRARFGVKIYALCDTDGYFWNSLVYIGKTAAFPLAAELGAIGALVVHIMQGLLNKGHQLFLDNFYTSLPLSECLLTNGTGGFCGTLRANHIGIPEALTNA